jgi:hypothetical protein
MRGSAFPKSQNYPCRPPGAWSAQSMAGKLRVGVTKASKAYQLCVQPPNLAILLLCAAVVAEIGHGGSSQGKVTRRASRLSPSNDCNRNDNRAVRFARDEGWSNTVVMGKAKVKEEKGGGRLGKAAPVKDGGRVLCLQEWPIAGRSRNGELGGSRLACRCTDHRASLKPVTGLLKAAKDRPLKYL